jgi:streptogramin lyase
MVALAPKPHRRRHQRTVASFVGVIAIVVGSALAACSPSSPPASKKADVPLQTGTQTTLPVDAAGYSVLSVDAKNVLYLAGGRGIATVAPGAADATPVRLPGSSTVLTLAAAPDGALYFVTTEGVVEKLAPGSTTPEPLPFDKLQQFSDIAVSRDGTVFLGDDERNVLLRLTAGASAPTKLAVEGVDGPGHMVVDADDNLFVSMKGKIVKIGKDATTAEPVDGATDHAGGLAVDEAGNLYATDVKANTVSRKPGGGGDWAQLPLRGLQSPTAITVDGDGNVYVLNRGARAREEVVRLAAE